VCRKVDLARDYIESATATIVQANEFEPEGPASADAPLAQKLWLKVQLGNVGNARRVTSRCWLLTAATRCK